jgi:hypothetical protein
MDTQMQQALNVGANPPQGALARFSGPIAGGWRVVSVWESQEAFEAFRRERMEPAFQKAGLPMPQLQSWTVDNLFIPN